MLGTRRLERSGCVVHPTAPMAVSRLRRRFPVLLGLAWSILTDMVIS